MRRQKQFVKYCLKQRVCGALLVSTPDQTTTSNLALRHRGVQFVVVNTTYHGLKDASGQPFTGTIQSKPPAVLHLFKRRKGGALSAVSYNGPFTSHNMAKFVDSHLLTTSGADADSEEGQLLLSKSELPELVSKKKDNKKKKKSAKDKKRDKKKKDEQKAAKDQEEKRKAAQRRREQQRRARMDKEAQSYIPQVCTHRQMCCGMGIMLQSE